MMINVCICHVKLKREISSVVVGIWSESVVKKRFEGEVDC